MSISYIFYLKDRFETVELKDAAEVKKFFDENKENIESVSRLTLTYGRPGHPAQFFERLYKAEA